MTHFYTRYVRYKDIKAYEKLGWRVHDPKNPSHHCHYAKIMKYTGDQEPPPEPEGIQKLC